MNDLLSKFELKQYNICKHYINACTCNQKIVYAVDRFLDYARRRSPAVYTVAVEKYIGGASWRTIAIKTGRSEDALRMEFNRVLDSYNEFYG